MKPVAVLIILMGAVGVSPTSAAQPDLLVNGDFEGTPADAYFDGSDPSAADDVPGWELFVGDVDGSYVLVSLDPSGTIDLDTGNGPVRGGAQTAAGSRPAVVAANTYVASLTYDNYFAPADAAYYIDWFDVSGSLINSSGGPLGDPNGPLGYAPYTQQLSISGVVPPAAVAAGVRFDSGNAGYAGLAADNFSLAAIPEPTSVALFAGGIAALFGMSRRRAR